MTKAFMVHLGFDQARRIARSDAAREHFAEYNAAGEYRDAEYEKD